jgi:hypothetical protein
MIQVLEAGKGSESKRVKRKEKEKKVGRRKSRRGGSEKRRGFERQEEAQRLSMGFVLSWLTMSTSHCLLTLSEHLLRAGSSFPSSV